MALPTAPYFADIAYGPETARAHWLEASDGVRLRFADWPVEGARGTVLIFPGRTEFIEKYGQIASALAAHGLSSAAVDWRGQGLADRALDNPLIGHIDWFSDYQTDVAAVVAAAETVDLPRPWFLLAHSMGGAIGLRALMRGLDVASVVFSGPMWGLQMAGHLRPAAWVLSTILPRLGRGHLLPPGTRLEHHVLSESFDRNLLTGDRAQFDIMVAQFKTHPELALGGPSFIWLREALYEMRDLARRASPTLPALTLVGSDEKIVSLEPIQSRMARWPGSQLEIVPEGRHEVLMDAPALTGPLLDRVAAHFLHPANT